MTRPSLYLIRMLVFLVVVGGVAGVLSPVLITAFYNNPVLNSLILLILLLGILWNLNQVLRLRPEVRWLETYQTSRSRLAALPSPKLLAPMASMLSMRDGRDNGRHFTLSTTAMRSLLDGLASRLDESRELSRYMTGLLIFLGLLGTFWGLLKTVTSVADVISSMSMGTGDINLMFEQLKTGLARPLAGMGTAFSASMYGLAGALVLGFLDLTAGQAQNRFFNELEEWLAGLTRLSSGLQSESEGSAPVYVQALLEQTAENMESLQRLLARGEENHSQVNQAVITSNEKLGVLADTIRASQHLMLRLAETQSSLAPALQRLGERQGDEASQGHLRNIEHFLQRLLAENEQRRSRATADLHNDLRLLTRTVAALVEPVR
jgi:hypothetical protein